jgi:hypothetical protein
VQKRRFFAWRKKSAVRAKKSVDFLDGLCYDKGEKVPLYDTAETIPQGGTVYEAFRTLCASA